MDAPRLDVPAAARAAEAGRSFRAMAAELRRATPPRRAASRDAWVEVDGDGSLHGLGLFATGVRSGALKPTHVELYHAALRGDGKEGVVCLDLPADRALTTDAPSQGAEADRVLTPELAPETALERAARRLARRQETAERVVDALEQVEGVGEAGSHVGVRVVLGPGHQLREVTLSSWITARGLEEANQALAQAVSSAREDLERAVREVLDEEEG